MAVIMHLVVLEHSLQIVSLVMLNCSLNDIHICLLIVCRSAYRKIISNSYCAYPAGHFVARCSFKNCLIVCANSLYYN